MTRALAAAALAICLLPAAAQAEPVLDLGEGQTPSAVTDAAGTLHVVWRQSKPVLTPLMYCRVAAGAGTCTPTQLTTNAQGAPHLLLRPSDGALIAVVSRPVGSDAGTWVLTSLDGGASWAGPTHVATGMNAIEDAELAPGGAAIDTVSSLGDAVRHFQRAPLTGGVETRVVSLGTHSAGTARVTELPDGRTAVLTEYEQGRLAARVAASGADPNVPDAWSPVSRRIDRIDARAIDSGPTGTWLLTRAATPRGDTYAVRLWRWDGRAFSLARRAGALSRPLTQPLGAGDSDTKTALDVDLAGRLHAVWTRNAIRCRGQQCLVYRRTDRRGFGPPIVYPVGAASGDAPEHLVAAANSGGSGWIVWGSLFDRIRAVPLVTPPLGSRVGSRRIGRRRVSIPDFYGCVPSGGTFVHRLKVDGRRGAQILSVRFFFDAGQPSATDRRAPWSQRFTLSFAPGTRHVAAAIVRYRLPGSRAARSVRLGRTFVMC